MGLFGKKLTIVVACKANVTRSPYLCGYMKHYLKHHFPKARRKVRILSAGIQAKYGRGASDVVQHIARLGGFSLRGHRTYPVDRRVVELADVILVMEKHQKTYILKRFPDAAEKTFLLTEYLRTDGSGQVRDIHDPTGMGAPDYEEFIASSHAEVSRIFQALRDNDMI